LGWVIEAVTIEYNVSIQAQKDLSFAYILYVLSTFDWIYPFCIF